MKITECLIHIVSFYAWLIKPSIVGVVVLLVCAMMTGSIFSNTVFSKERGEITLICEPTFVDRKTLRFSGANDGLRPATIIFTIDLDSHSVHWWSENFEEQQNVFVDDRTFLVTTSKKMLERLQVINIRRYTGEWSYGKFSFEALGKCHETGKPEKRF